MSATKPRPYHHGSLRETLLDAATTLLARHGAGGLTLREVAKAADVSHAAPYHHFASLDELLAGVAGRGFEALGDAMARARAGADSRENLLAINDAYVVFARRQPALFKLMFGPLLARKAEHPALRDSAERAFGVLMQAAAAHDPVQGPLLGLAGWSLAHGVASLAIEGAFDTLPIHTPDPQRLARQMAERLLPPAASALSEAPSPPRRPSSRKRGPAAA